MKIGPDTVAIVTGANRANGIGFALVHALLERGCGHVVGSYRRPETSRALLDLAESEQRLSALALDLTDPASAEGFAEGCLSRFERLDLLINNAGLGSTRAATILDATIEQFEQQLQVHVVGPLRMARLLRPLLEQSPQPVILNISSGLGQMQRVGASYIHYGPAKAAQNAMTRQLAGALRGKGVVMAINPGWVQTDMGGGGAPVSPPRSANGILDIAERADQNDNGRFYDLSGEEMEW
jgi:NAD(P)-dependent dehydrogenase (short-subunit alcohol dehydrogenase family)